LPALRSEVTIIISIGDANDNAPKFLEDSFTASVAENASPGPTLVKVTATDPDVSSILTFHLKDAGSTPAFAIDPSTGAVTALRRLDRESVNMHVLQVAVTDGAFTVTTSVVITVMDLNDSPPVFVNVPSQIHVSEADALPNRQLMAVEVTDDDLGANADIVLSASPADTVSVSSDGVVTLLRLLDREQAPTVSFTLTATNRADADDVGFVITTSVTIVLGEVNDLAPVFSQPAYFARVREDARGGTLITTVTATDGDEAQTPNSLVTYSYTTVGQDAFLPFTLDPSSGALQTLVPLDREVITQLILNVTATDAGQPPLTASVLLTVDIADANDNPPVLVIDAFQLSFREGDGPLVVAPQLDISDGDGAALQLMQSATVLLQTPYKHRPSVEYPDCLHDPRVWRMECRGASEALFGGASAASVKGGPTDAENRMLVFAGDSAVQADTSGLPADIGQHFDISGWFAQAPDNQGISEVACARFLGFGICNNCFAYDRFY